MDDGARRRSPTTRASSTTRTCSPAPSRSTVRASTTRTRPPPMCYTTGTTGNPKGVVYSHRSMLLHSLARARRRRRLSRARRRAAGRADVPRQRLGPAARGRDGAAPTLVLPGPDLRPARSLELIEPSRSRSPAACRRSGWACCRCSSGHDLSVAAARSSAAARRCRSRCRRPTATQIGHPDPAGLGHDRDQPDRLGVLAARASLRRPRRGARPTSAPRRGIAGAAGRPADRRARQRRRAAVGRRRHRRAAGPRARGSRRTYYTTDGRRRAVHRRRLAAHRRRRDDRPARLHPARRPHQGPGQVRRRVDQLGRAGERDHGPPEDRRGRGDRRPRTRSGSSGRWPASCVKEGESLDEGRGAASSSPRGWRSGGCPTTSMFIDEVPKTSVGKFSKKTLRDKFSDYPLPS